MISCRRVTLHILILSKDILDTLVRGVPNSEDFDITIKNDPDDAIAYFDRGLAKEALGQQDAAKADFQKAKELDLDVERRN